MENSQAEKKKGKRIFKNEISLRELWGNIKHTNICIIGALEGEEKEEGAENLFEEIIAENLPNLERKQISKSRKHKMNPERHTPRHIVIKMAKVKERI